MWETESNFSLSRVTPNHSLKQDQKTITQIVFVGSFPVSVSKEDSRPFFCSPYPTFPRRKDADWLDELWTVDCTESGEWESK